MLVRTRLKKPNSRTLLLWKLQPNATRRTLSRINLLRMQHAQTNSSVRSWVRNFNPLSHLPNYNSDKNHSERIRTSATRTLMRVDNTTTSNCACNNLQQKKSKYFDIWLHCLSDLINNNPFETHWIKGELNYADYYSKHHAVVHHKNIPPMCLIAHSSILQHLHSFHG